MKRFRGIVLTFIAVLSVLAEAHAGRWLSRDPIAEDAGFVQRDPMPQTDLDIDQENEPNVYGFVANQPLTKWDYLGLLTAGGGVPSRNVIEHESYLRFNVTCPSCSQFVWEYVDYSGAVSALEGLDGKNYIDNLAGAIPPAAGLGGLSDIQNVNCVGKPTTVDVYMKTRLAGRGWPWIVGNGSGSAAANAYAAGTVIHYHCLSCAAPSTPTPNNPVPVLPNIPP